MSDRLTPAALREHATAPSTPFWDGQSRQMLNWAADVLEAAQKVLDERQAPFVRAECMGGRNGGFGDVIILSVPKDFLIEVSVPYEIRAVNRTGNPHA